MPDVPQWAVDGVRRFGAALREIRQQLLLDLPGHTSILDVAVAVRSARTLPREGVTANGVAYSVHGSGCWMADNSGREVDVGLVRDPASGREVEAFDAWRIRWFLRNADGTLLADDDVTDACSYLVDTGELEEVEAGRWFSLPE